MKKMDEVLGIILCGTCTLLATGWWFYVSLLGPEVSELLKNESLFGAMLWWLVLALATSFTDKKVTKTEGGE